jgi:hypothetical protein
MTWLAPVSDQERVITPLEPSPDDETIPMLTEVLEIPVSTPASAPEAGLDPSAEWVERLRESVTTQVLQQLEDAIDIGFRAELQRALQDAVDDACDSLQSSLNIALKQAVARAVDEALSNRPAQL